MPAVKEAPLLLLVPTWALVLANVYFGLDTDFSVGMAERAVEAPGRRCQMNAETAADDHPVAAPAGRCRRSWLRVVIPIVSEAVTLHDRCGDGRAGAHDRPPLPMDGETFFVLPWMSPYRASPSPSRSRLLGMLFALVAGLLWVVTSIYSIGYMRGHNEQNQTRFFAAFAVAISATIGIAFSANLFTLFLFYELLTLSTYPLVAHAARRGQAGRTDLSRTAAGHLHRPVPAGHHRDLVAAGTLDFQAGGILAGHIDPAWAGLLYALFLFGIGKAAADAVSSLAAGGDGGADTGQRPAARGRRGQGRGLHPVQGDVYIFGGAFISAQRRAPVAWSGSPRPPSCSPRWSP